MTFLMSPNLVSYGHRCPAFLEELKRSHAVATAYCRPSRKTLP